jgi:ribosomal 50S subunit-associated protein YjgA (DUF615 family)
MSIEIESRLLDLNDKEINEFIDLYNDSDKLYLIQLIRSSYNENKITFEEKQKYRQTLHDILRFKSWRILKLNKDKLKENKN